MSDIISIVKLKKYFQSGDVILKVIDDLSIKMPQGKIMVITGESGVGKSTLLSLIGGLDYVTAGDIFIKTENITRLNENQITKFRLNNVGFVFQHHFLLQEFTAYENILLPYLIKSSLIPNEIHQYIMDLLNIVHLTDRKDHKPGQLSGGECQRIALLRALVNRPELILADEPTGSLDEKNTHTIFNLIKQLNKKYDFTFIIATHNMIVRKYCHQLYLLKNGKLLKK